VNIEEIERIEVAKMDRSPGQVFQTRVLLVEDDGFTRAIIGEAIADTGMVVRTADSVAAAMTILNDFEPHVIISDLDLGNGPNGADLLKRINKERPWVGLVVLSSHTSPTLAVSSSSTIPEGTIYLVKGRMASIDDIKQAVEAAITRAHVREIGTIQDDSERVELSQSQAEILRLMAEGYSNAGIAQERGTSMRAAESLIQRTLVAMGIEADSMMNSRVRAVRMWQQGRVIVR
jgi:DNA-binding NarL/FixJ family response regulator